MSPRRRPKGEGSVYQEKSTGRWIVAMDVGYADGQRKRIRRVARTEAEALAKRDELRAELRRRGLIVDLDVDLDRLTIAQFLETWLRDVAEVTFEQSTVDGYRYHVRTHIIPSVGRVKLMQLGPQHVQAMMRSMLAAGMSPSTITGTRNALSSALEVARSWRYVTENVARLADPPPLERLREPRALSVAEMGALLKAAAGHRLEAIYLLGLASGLRRGEVLGLLWVDVDFEAGMLHVRAQQGESRQGRRRAPKRRSFRSQRLPASVAAALRAHRKRQDKEREDAGDLWDEHGLVFTTRQGKPLSPRNVLRMLQEVHGPKAGLAPIMETDPVTKRSRVKRSDVTWHDLRHTYSSQLARRGVDVRLTQDAMGHADITTTANVYTHVDNEGRGIVAAAVDGLLEEVAGYVSPGELDVLGEVRDFLDGEPGGAGE